MRDTRVRRARMRRAGISNTVTDFGESAVLELAHSLGTDSKAFAYFPERLLFSSVKAVPGSQHLLLPSRQMREQDTQLVRLNAGKHLLICLFGKRISQEFPKSAHLGPFFGGFV